MKLTKHQSFHIKVSFTAHSNDQNSHLSRKNPPSPTKQISPLSIPIQLTGYEQASVSLLFFFPFRLFFDTISGIITILLTPEKRGDRAGLAALYTGVLDKSRGFPSPIQISSSLPAAGSARLPEPWLAPAAPPSQLACP